MDEMPRVIYCFSYKFYKKGSKILFEYKWKRCFNFELFKLRDILIFSFDLLEVTIVKPKISYSRE